MEFTVVSWLIEWLRPRLPHDTALHGSPNAPLKNCNANVQPAKKKSPWCFQNDLLVGSKEILSEPACFGRTGGCSALVGCK